MLKWIGFKRIVAAAGCVIVMACSAGCRQDDITPPPTEFIVWGDPQSDTTSGAVSDIGNRGFRIALDGRIQATNGLFCEGTCDVNTDGEVFIDGGLRAEIRWSDTTGPDGEAGTADDERRPFFVSTDGFYINIDALRDGFVFTPSDLEIDPDGVAGDDRAIFIGTVTDDADPAQPSTDQTQTTPALCGILGWTFFPMTVAGIAFLRAGRRRGF